MFDHMFQGLRLWAGRLAPASLTILLAFAFTHAGMAQEKEYQCVLFVNDGGEPLKDVRADVFGDDGSSTWALTDTGGIAAFGMVGGVVYEVYVLERGYNPFEFTVNPAEWTEDARIYDVALTEVPFSRHYYGLAVFDSCAVTLEDSSFENGLSMAVETYGDVVSVKAELIYYYDTVPCHQELAGERIDVVLDILADLGFNPKEVKLEWKPYKPVKIGWIGSGFPIGTVLDEEYISQLNDPEMQDRARRLNLRLEVHLYSY